MVFYSELQAECSNANKYSYHQWLYRLFFIASRKSEQTSLQKQSHM